MPNSTEYRGVGQSGYTAGRAEHDNALDRDVQTRNAELPKNLEEDQHQGELDVDDRFTGRGGAIPPDAPAEETDEPQ
jgi:hypothetical protein